MLNFHQFLVTARIEIDPMLLTLIFFSTSITSLILDYSKIHTVFCLLLKETLLSTNVFLQVYYSYIIHI